MEKSWLRPDALRWEEGLAMRRVGKGDIRLAPEVEYYLWVEGDGPGCDICCAECGEPERHGGCAGE